MTDALNRALARLQAGDVTGAITAIREGVAAAPADVELRLTLGALLGKLGDHQGAVAAFEEARAAAPAEKRGPISAALAGCYDALGRTDDAIAAARDALAADPTLVPPALLLATHLALRGVRDEALALYRSIVDRVGPELKPHLEETIRRLAT